jgi:hypothetical protein
MTVIGKTFAVAGVGAMLLACSPEVELAAQAQSIPGCVQNPDVGDALKAGTQVPCDFAAAQTGDPLAEHYRFAWNTFFAVSWPALTPDQLRGVPDGSKSFIDAGTPVWDTWKEKRQLYRVVPNPQQQGKYIWSTADPGPFQTPPTGLDPNSTVKMCSGETAPTGSVRTVQASKIDNFADEVDEIGLVALWQADTGYPTDESLIRYQVKFNADYWSFVRDNGFYASDKLNAFIQQTASESNKVGAVAFPMSSNSDQINGAIMTKAGWRMLDENDDPSKYYTVEMLYYDTEEKGATEASAGDDEDNEVTCFRQASFGLIAIHVVRKTEQFPYFFYSTFEHKANYPNVYNYANTKITNDASVPSELLPASCQGVKVPTSGTQSSAILPNGCGIEYTRPANPVVGVPEDKNGPKPYKADRLISARPALSQVNMEADEITSGSVWNNYRLVGVQTVPVEGELNDENPADDQDYYLANPVVETSQRFQYFTGDFASPRIVNVFKNHDDNSSVMMGGCMGCHGAGAQGASRTLAQVQGGSGGTDFSFTLQNVRNEPTEPTAAESIDSVCQEIKLDTASDGRSCVSR